MTYYFEKFAILLNEEAFNEETPVGITDSLPTLEPRAKETEDLVDKMGKLLKAKIRAHSGLEPALCTPNEILKKNTRALVPILYRIATENFIRTSKNTFKIIEFRNVTKLVTDWKPRIPDILLSLGHQVIIVELKESFSLYNDFAYSILRLLHFDWRIRLPRSFFYPEDVCMVKCTAGSELMLVTPYMPDGEIEIPDRVKKTLQYDILMMMKTSCESAMENHLLMRDLRVGEFAKAFDGVDIIRSVYRGLQKKIRSGSGISLGTGNNILPEDSNLLAMTGAGDTLRRTEAVLKELKEIFIDNDETVLRAVAAMKEVKESLVDKEKEQEKELEDDNDISSETVVAVLPPSALDGAGDGNLLGKLEEEERTDYQSFELSAGTSREDIRFESNKQSLVGNKITNSDEVGKENVIGIDCSSSNEHRKSIDEQNDVVQHESPRKERLDEDQPNKSLMEINHIDLGGGGDCPGVVSWAKNAIKDEKPRNGPDRNRNRPKARLINLKYLLF